MSDEKTPTGGFVVIALNPLIWPAADPVIGPVAGEVTTENLLNFLHGPFAHTSLEELRARYGKISEFDGGLIAVPQHPRLFNGIVTPLHNAKAAYVIGHYLSCIALCGVICEMVAIFRFEIANMKCAGKPLDDDRQRLLWGRTFEMLGQKDRIGVLEVFGLLDQKVIQALNDVQGIRRRYMHLLRDDKGQESADALQAYSCAIQVCVAVIGAKVQPGSHSIEFHPNVNSWLMGQGLVMQQPGSST
jgi:hypothetical protein